MFNWGKKYKWGIALGGGGARGFAHLGVLEALNEKGIYPDIISGTSTGAIAAAFLASGHSPYEALKKFTKYDFYDLSNFRIPRGGLLLFDKLEETLKKEIEAENIEDLKPQLSLRAPISLAERSNTYKRAL